MYKIQVQVCSVIHSRILVTVFSIYACKFQIYIKNYLRSIKISISFFIKISKMLNSMIIVCFSLVNRNWAWISKLALLWKENFCRLSFVFTFLVYKRNFESVSNILLCQKYMIELILLYIVVFFFRYKCTTRKDNRENTIL